MNDCKQLQRGHGVMVGALVSCGAFDSFEQTFASSMPDSIFNQPNFATDPQNKVQSINEKKHGLFSIFER